MEEVEKEATRSRAYQLSELLINDPGEPKNWNQTSSNDEIKRIGLSDETLNRQNLISSKKTGKLDNDFDCLDDGEYNQLREKLGLEDEYFSIIISEIDIENNGNRIPIYTCIPSPSAIRSVNTTITRIIVINDTGELKPSELIVQM